MKRMFTMLLALTMVVSLAACKENADTATPDTTENITQPTTEVTEPSTEVTEPSEDVTEPTVEWIDGKEYCYRPDGSLLYSRIFDDSGKVAERLAYRDGEQFLRWEYQYDADGLLNCVRIYNENDCEFQIWECSAGTLVTEITGQSCTDTIHTDDDTQKIWVYDENWNLLEECYYRDGQQDWGFLFTYDKSGYLTSQTSYDKGEEVSRTTHVRDENGDVIQEDYYYRGNQRYSFQYTENGTIQTHYENNTPFWRCKYSSVEEYSDVDFFNEQGQVVQSIRYEGSRELWCRSFTYDENGDLVREDLQEAGENESVYRELYYYDGSIVHGYSGSDGWDYEAEYDEQGRLLWENTACDYEFGENNHISYHYNADGSYTTIWVGATCGRYYAHYDSNGNLLERYGDDDPGDDPDPSQVGEWDRYEYNEYGDVIRSEHYYFGELEISYRYEYRYDENGRWIECVCYSDNAEISRTSREYTFDAEGNLTELREESDYEIFTESYTYDEAGRLTQKIGRYIEK